MDKQIALLRGINVGRAKRVAMADLRALVESLGYQEVRTLLNSGNVVFVTREGTPLLDSASRIEDAVLTQLGVSAKVITLSAQELDDIVVNNPLVGVADDPSRLLVAVFADPMDGVRIKSLLEQDWKPEVIALGKRAAYLWCPEGVLDSSMVKAVGKIIGHSVTTRNWATVLKLHAICHPEKSEGA